MRTLKSFVTNKDSIFAHTKKIGIRMNRNFSLMKQACAVIACSLAFWGCKQTTQPQTSTEHEVMTIAPTNRTLSSSYPATIKGRQDIEIYPQVSGKLTQLCVTEGQRVKKGQTLFIIDQVPYEAALQTAIANVEAAKASLANAKLTYESKQSLYAEKVVSEFDLNTAQNAMLTAQAQLAQMEAQEVNARNNLSYTVVTSPSDGVVGTLPYRVGALVSSAIPQPLTTVSDNSVMYVYFSMTENRLLEMIRQYGSKDRALEQMPSIKLRLSDNSIYAHEGKIETISGVIDQATGSVSLRAAFPNAEGLLHSGGTGSVIIPVQKNNIFVIPQAATYEIQDQRYTFKVVDGKAQATLIKVTQVDGGEEFIVNEGLKQGDVIVAKGAGLLREGTVINTKKSTADQ